MYRFLVIAFLVSCSSSMTCNCETSHEVITVGNIDSECIQENRASLTQIVHSRIAKETRLSKDANVLADSESGRAVLATVISCALPADITLVSDRGIKFSGELGLASDWLSNPIDSNRQRWITACVLAKVRKEHQTTVFVMRGYNRALSGDYDKRVPFVVEAGAFYGNIFERLDQPLDWVACRGRDETEVNTCAQEDPSRRSFTKCGFKFAGRCQYACKSFAHGQYDDCRDNDHAVEEVVTIWTVQ